MVSCSAIYVFPWFILYIHNCEYTDKSGPFINLYLTVVHPPDENMYNCIARVNENPKVLSPTIPIDLLVGDDE